MKRFFIFFLLISAFATCVFAQQAFEDYVNKQFGEFQKFKEERDKEFTEFLKKQWGEFNAFKGIDFDPVPKPDKIPEAEPEKAKEIPEAPKIKEQEIPTPAKPEPIKKIKPTVPVEKPSETAEIKFNFYKTEINIDFDNKISETFESPVNNDKISKYWEKLSTADYSSLIKQIKEIRDKLQLQDWGTYLLTRAVSQDIHRDKNSAQLLQWYILSKLGYDTKIGFKDNKIYLLLPSEHTLYGITYFTIDKTRYYAIDTLFTKEKIKSLKTYEGKYEGADKFAFFKTENPRFGTYDTGKTLSFNYSADKYSLKLKYNENYVNYYKFFPQTFFNAYFAAPPSPGFQNSIVNDLNKIITGKSEEEAVNIILRFVQKAFKYKTDIDQFGYEKYLTPDETVFYPYSDCEDRSILFAYLIKSVLGLDVVLLDYPGHVATAVSLSKNISIDGDSITYNGKKYYVADPTYINATLGMTMPLVKNKKFEIISLKN